MSGVPEGYKMSEVGVIPEEWDVKTLENITTEIGDGIHSTPQYVPYSDIFFVNGNNLVDNSIKITDNTLCVSEYEYNKHKKRLNDRTILLSINGTIGNIAFFNDEKVILGKSAAYINVNNSTNKIFIFYILQSSGIKNYFEDELTGSTIRNLSLKTIRNTPIALPPTIEEQEAIASALSDVDALIAALAQLITKKRNIKRGAMQQLLTGKKRLPGFEGAWEVKRLEGILQSAKLGGNYPNSEKETNYPLIKMGNINRGFIDLSKIEFITTGYIPSENDKLEYGDILFNTRNTLELVGKVSIWKNELPLAYYNSNLMRLEFKQSEVSSNFFMNYILNTKGAPYN
ncbi:Type-1 restriction enzyme MjaXIP specificity protein [ANME-1 cluster archaeon GoMg3.2]|nr:Type-1 restriction enzyme MjaXIP specificity protein [ANME-1 cluster archaeon GoMg3.2]